MRKNKATMIFTGQSTECYKVSDRKTMTIGITINTAITSHIP